MQEWERAWLACAIEGEGCISIRKAKLSPAARKLVKRGFAWRATIQISNNSEEFCKMAQKITGTGKIRAAHRENIDRKTTYMWRLPCSKVASILKEIKPYLVIPRKIRLAELAIEMRRLVKEHVIKAINDPRIEEIYDEAKKLNSRGISGFTTDYANV